MDLWAIKDRCISKKRHAQTIETVGDFEIARLMMTGILRQRFHRGECIVSAMSDSSRED